MVSRVPLLLFFDEILDQAQETERGKGEDGEGVDGAVRAGADDVVVQYAYGRGRRCGGAAPWWSDIALLEANDSAGKAGFKNCGGRVFAGGHGGVVEGGDGGGFLVVDEDDGV